MTRTDAHACHAIIPDPSRLTTSSIPTRSNYRTQTPLACWLPRALPGSCPTRSGSARTGLTLRSSWSRRRQVGASSLAPAVPPTCHKQRSRAVCSGQSRSLQGGRWARRPSLTWCGGGDRNCMDGGNGARGLAVLTGCGGRPDPQAGPEVPPRTSRLLAAGAPTRCGLAVLALGAGSPPRWQARARGGPAGRAAPEGH
jgi:hypothetical protein